MRISFFLSIGVYRASRSNRSDKQKLEAAYGGSYFVPPAIGCSIHFFTRGGILWTILKTQ